MATSTDATDREIVLAREFAAPRGLVYRAWTDPARIGNWWGPNGFTTTTHEFALKPGGVWRHTMHGPDGTDYPNRVTFTEVVPNERLEYDHDADEHDGPEPFHVTVTFEDRSGGTLLTLRMRCVSAEACDHMKRFGAVEGGEQTLARLADELAGPTVGEAVVFTRTFAAPRALVYQAWTDPAHVARWWGPRGFTNPVCEWDARPGGAINVHMAAPGGGPVFPMGGTFREVVPGERLVFTATALFDEAGVPQLETRTTVTFADRGAATEVMVRAEVVKATPAAAGALAGMEAGWGQSLDKLADELATADREIVSTRLFDAPRELVFRAFADPAHLARWWGPKGFTDTVHEFDPRPGGTWRHTMHGPDGTDYVNESVFVEVVEPERVVFDHLRTMHRFRMTLTFADDGGRTRVTWRMRFDTAEECARVRTFAAPANEENFDRLAPVLDELAVEFVVRREFAAPRALVFKAWTDAGHLANWFGPAGCATTVAANDPRPGGVMHYRMGTPDGGAMWGRWVWRELTPPDRLAFVASFSDPDGGVARAPFSADWPLEVLSTVTFTEHAGKTTLTMRGVPVNATAAERAAFAAMHGSMTNGWGGTLDRLDTHLSGGA